MTTQPEALRLADAIDPLTRQSLDNLTCSVAAAELRRLHGEVKSMRAERLNTERRLREAEDENGALKQRLAMNKDMCIAQQDLIAALNARSKA